MAGSFIARAKTSYSSRWAHLSFIDHHRHFGGKVPRPSPQGSGHYPPLSAPCISRTSSGSKTPRKWPNLDAPRAGSRRLHPTLALTKCRRAGERRLQHISILLRRYDLRDKTAPPPQPFRKNVEKCQKKCCIRPPWVLPPAPAVLNSPCEWSIQTNRSEAGGGTLDRLWHRGSSPLPRRHPPSTSPRPVGLRPARFRLSHRSRPRVLGATGS